MIRRPPRSTLFPYTRSSDLTGAPYQLPDGSTTDVFPGANFEYLSTNVVVDATGETLFPAYATKRFKSEDRKSTRLNSSHDQISYAVFCLKKKKTRQNIQTPT